MFLKCYHYLHPMEKSKVGYVDQTTNGDFDLDIFEQTSSTSELTLELVRRETLIFKCYQVDSKEIKCLLQWWTKYETMFPTVFLAHQILRIVGSQIETKRIFSLIRIFTNVKSYCL
jgi:hypothetical protein